MINGIGPTPNGRLEGPRATAIQRGSPAPKAGGVARDAGAGSASLAADLVAASGPPLDMAKIEAIRAAIAEGRYAIDAHAIADRMVELDLPATS